MSKGPQQACISVLCCAKQKPRNVGHKGYSSCLVLLIALLLKSAQHRYSCKTICVTHSICTATGPALHRSCLHSFRSSSWLSVWCRAVCIERCLADAALLLGCCKVHEWDDPALIVRRFLSLYYCTDCALLVPVVGLIRGTSSSLFRQCCCRVREWDSAALTARRFLSLYCAGGDDDMFSTDLTLQQLQVWV